jgi:hypothetical protein
MRQPSSNDINGLAKGRKVGAKDPEEKGGKERGARVRGKG